MFGPRTPSEVAEVNFSTLATAHNEGNREGAAKSIQKPIIDIAKWVGNSIPNLFKRATKTIRNAAAKTVDFVTSGITATGEAISDTLQWGAETTVKLATTPIAVASNIVYQVMNVVPSLFPIRTAVIGIDYASILARKPGEYSNRAQKATAEKTGNWSNTVKSRINSTRKSIFDTIAGPQEIAA